MTSLSEITAVVAAQYNRTPDELRGKQRLREYVVPRQICFKMAHEARFSLTQIGRFYGGRDHTTVGHGIKRYTDLMVDHSDQIEAIRAALFAPVFVSSAAVPELVFKSRRVG